MSMQGEVTVPPKGTDESVAFKYPYLAFLLGDPEVGPLLRQADNGTLSSAEFQAALMQTSWWKRTSDSERTYFALRNADPATYERRRNDLKAQIAVIVGEMGFPAETVDAGYLDFFADKALRFSMSSAQIRAMIADEIVPLVGPSEKSNVLRDIRKVQTAYQYMVDSDTLNYWSREILAGRQTVENFENNVRQQVKGLFPHLATQLDSGMTFKQIIAPYRELLSREFDGASVEEFDFFAPKWRQVIDYVDPKTGVHRSMSVQEVTEYARSQAEWRNTKTAKERVAEVGEQLLASFGAVQGTVR